MKRISKIIVAAFAAAFAFTLIAAPSYAETPTFQLTYTPPGVQLTNGTVFEDNGHINIHTTNGNYNFHFESKCINRTDAECKGDRHAVAQYIGKDFFPLNEFIAGLGCVKWIQVSGHSYHYKDKNDCVVPTPTPSGSPSPTPSETGTPTPSPSVTPTPTPTPTPTQTSTPEPTPEPTDTPKPTPTATATPTPTPTPEPTSTPTPSSTGTPSPTVTPEPTPSDTPEVTPTPSDTPTQGIGTPEFTTAPAVDTNRRGLAETGGNNEYLPYVVYGGLITAVIGAGMLVRRRRFNA